MGFSGDSEICSRRGIFLRILFLVPHPFYEDRGSPIAVGLLLKALSARGERVDVITYPLGRDVSYENIAFYRTRSLPFIRYIRPGFSWKKVICDGFMLFRALRFASKRRYDIVHAIEESVFIALFLRCIFRIPYIYDMDSSLVDQMIERYPFLSLFKSFFRFFEKLAIQKAQSVLPVCQALANKALQYRSGGVHVLQDVSLLSQDGSKSMPHLRDELQIKDLIVMYVGNLESYQGIDLLLESFKLALGEGRGTLVIIGGGVLDIGKYREKAACMGIQRNVHFLGPKPVGELYGYLSQADILISPRIKGANTPMKLFSYLHSGKPVLATDLETHTQILTDQVAMLASPNPEAFSKALMKLVENVELREKLGEAGKNFVEKNFSLEKFRDKVNTLYDDLRREIISKAG